MRLLIVVLASLGACCGATAWSSMHLITACIGFYTDVHNIAKEVMTFDTTTCLHHVSEVEPAVNKVIARAATESRVALLASVSNMLGAEEPYARAIKAGIAVFFIEIGIDFAKFGLHPRNMLSIVFFPDNGMGARATGRELCRVRGQQTEQRVALFYGVNPELDVRCDGVIEEFRNECPHVNLQVVRTLRSPDWGFDSAKELIKPVFLAEPTLTGVITAADIIGMGVNAAADELLPPADAERLVVTGFDHADFVVPFLANKRIFATVDQLSNKIASTGMWHTMPNFLQVVRDQDLNSTEAVQQYFGLSDHVVLVPTLHVASDGEGQTSAKLAATMAETVRATPLGGGGPSVVSVRVQELQVQKFLVDDGAWHGNFWVELSWHDQRLRWDALQYNGTLAWDASQLWYPKLLLVNRQTIDAVITTGRAVIRNDGLVTLRTKFQGDFQCPLSAAAFPFTLFTCSIEIGSHESNNSVHFKLGGFEVDSVPADYYPLEIVDARVAGSKQSARFTFRAVHDPFFVLSGYVLVAWILNVISFSQLYLPSNDDRTGFAMATILAAMVLQMEAKESAVFTWLDLYLLLSLLSQVTAFMTSIFARRTAHFMSMDEEALCSQTLAARTLSLEIRHHIAYRLLLVMFGLLDPSMNAADRWARRLQPPSFLVLCVLMCFGPLGVSQHPDHGLQCPLLWMSVAALVPFLVGTMAIMVPGHSWSFWSIRKTKARFEQSVGGAPPELRFWPHGAPPPNLDAQVLRPSWSCSASEQSMQSVQSGPPGQPAPPMRQDPELVSF